MMQAVTALALLLAAQDFGKSKSEFLDAVKSMDESRVRSAADAVAASDNREAVDVLLDGYGICAQQIKFLWQEKLKNLQEVEANSDFKIDTSTNPPTIPQSEVAKYQKYQKAVLAAQETEKKIMRVEGVKRHIVKAMTVFRSDAAVKQLLSKLRSDSQWTRRAGVAEALGDVQHPDIETALVEALKKDSEPQVRIAILDALRARGARSEAVVGALVEQLRHELWQVRVTAVQTIKAIGSKDGKPAIEPLIAALEKADGRMKTEINEALIALTGVDKHGDFHAWKSWWEQNQESVKGDRYTPKNDEKPNANGGGGTTFYGIPVNSKNVIFVLDRSGSMAEPSEWDLPADVSSGGGKGAPGDIKLEGNRKIDIARWQLKLALAGLPDGTEFNLIFFNHEWTIMSEKMVKMSSAARKAAFDFIDKLDPVGGTNVYDPTEKAFTFAGVGLQDKIYKSNVDTIFLLTDGMPNAGQIPNANDIITKIREMNKLKKVKINTIGVFSTAGGGMMQPSEAEEGSKFLKQLAEDSGGKYVSAFKKKK
jgi:hypothetical protein